MDESRKKSKVIGYILGIFAFIAIVVGATYAWLTWRSNSITLSGLSECFDVIYYRKDLGTAQNPAKLRFMTTYNRDNMNQLVANQDYAEVGLSLDPNCTNLAGLGKIYLTTNANTSSAILTGGLYYTLIKVENNTETFIKEGPITSTGDMLLLENIFVSTTTGGTKYRVYIWINGPITTDQSYVGSSYIGEIRAEVVSQEDNTPPVYLAQHITDLYTNATKTTVENNSITYSYATSEKLMNDRHASMSTGADAGDIRYYGANPNNYVWLGDTFTTDYTYTSNGESLTRTAGSKKLWRVIGVFDGRLKLIAADPISTQSLSWDTSANVAGENNGMGINQWGPSGSYEGADLMRLLNEGYTGTNGSLYWNKTAGTVYTGGNNATTANVSFANTGLSASEKNLIDSVTWYLGAWDGVYSSGVWDYSDDLYAAERQNSTLGKICSSGNYCNDEVTRTSSWNGKVGLMYPSDYGYAVDLSLCTNGLFGYTTYPGDGTGYDNTNCKTNNWLYNSSYSQWTISPRAGSSRAADVFNVAGNGFLNHSAASAGYRVRPAIYLKASTLLTGGDGTEANPYTVK